MAKLHPKRKDIPLLSAWTYRDFRTGRLWVWIADEALQEPVRQAVGGLLSGLLPKDISFAAAVADGLCGRFKSEFEGSRVSSIGSLRPSGSSGVQTIGPKVAWVELTMLDPPLRLRKEVDAVAWISKCLEEQFPSLCPPCVFSRGQVEEVLLNKDWASKVWVPSVKRMRALTVAKELAMVVAEPPLAKETAVLMKQRL